MSASRLQIAKRCHEVPLFLNFFILFSKIFNTRGKWQSDPERTCGRGPSCGRDFDWKRCGLQGGGGGGGGAGGGGGWNLLDSGQRRKKKKTRVDFRVVLLQTSNYTAALAALSKIWPQSKDVFSLVERVFIYSVSFIFFPRAAQQPAQMLFKSFFFLRPRSEPGNIEEEELQHWNEEFD